MQIMIDLWFEMHVRGDCLWFGDYEICICFRQSFGLMNGVLGHDSAL